MIDLIFMILFFIIICFMQIAPIIIIIYVIRKIVIARNNGQLNLQSFNTTIGNNFKTNTNSQNVIPATVDTTYFNNINKILDSRIEEELTMNNIDSKITVPYIEKRKNIYTLIFCVVSFLLISLLFFHFSFSLQILILEIINIIVFILFNKKYTVKSYLKKQIKARPDEKISNIVSALTQEGYLTNSQYVRYSFLALSLVLPLLIFVKPRTFYEKTNEGYVVRFYTVGLKNEKIINIPETYKNEPIVGIRGNVFANLGFLVEINLPDTIKEIRGKAFANDTNLKNIKLPSKLEYLGGSAFLNCTSLTTIKIPETVTEINGNTFEGCTSLESIELHDNITSIHGSAFLNCKALKSIKLPNNITEIRGNTFQNCSSLTSIEIPNKVTRIGGHAFHGCTSLSEVKLPDGLLEIGSSAFRDCSSLKNIKIPKNTHVNERAFKNTYVTINEY